jgi:CSLREA domain-containing protein
VRVGFCVIVLCFVIVAPARAGVIPVTTLGDVVATDGLCSLREAITAANQNSPPGDCLGGDATATDVVRLGAATYVLALPGAGEDVNASGDLDVAPPGGPLRIEGAGAAATTISAAGLGDRVLDISIVDGVTIAGLTLADGVAQNGEDGGGIRSGGPLTLVDAAVANNRAADGAAGAPGGGGGGIRTSGALTLTRTTVSGNVAGNGGAGAAGDAGGAGGNGGGISASGALTIDRSRIVGNRSGDGGTGGSGDTGGPGGSGGMGAGVRADGTLTMTGTLVTGNATGAGADGGDGGVDTGGAGGNGGSGAGLSATIAPVVRFSTFVGNAVGNGGIAGTSANGPPPIQGANGSGTAIAGAFTPPVNVGRTILIGSCAGGFVDAGANLGAATAGCPGSSAAPRLSAAGVPLAGSPAIDGAPVAGCPASDLAGRARPQGVRCDIGAFEVAAGTLTYSRTSLAFPVVRVGSASTLAVTVGNSGLAGLALPVSIGGAGFRIAARTCAAELAGGRTCGVTVAFAPTAAGQFSGSLRLGGRTLPLSGTGVAAPIAAAPKKCVVPKLKGKTVKQARRALKKRNCRLGKVTRRGRGRPGRIRASRPKAGSVRAAGTRVRVIVNRARAR